MHPQASTITRPTEPAHRYHWKIVWKKRLAVAARWLHIYLSMLSFAIVLFFAVTGLTLNHPDWLAGQERTVKHQGSLDMKLIKPTVDKLQIVEHLRSVDGVKGALSEFRIDDVQLNASFKGPGYSADAFIDPQTGEYDITETRMGAGAVLNDLHKGRDSGKGWGWVIDISAVLLTLLSFTGLIILFFLARRRISGLVSLVVGAVVCFAVYRIFVP